MNDTSIHECIGSESLPVPVGPISLYELSMDWAYLIGLRTYATITSGLLCFGIVAVYACMRDFERLCERTLNEMSYESW